MTDIEKELIIKDISSRLPYGLKLQVNLMYGDNGHKEGFYKADLESITPEGFCEVSYYDGEDGSWIRDWTFCVDEIKPYLRPLSSITENELEEIKDKIKYSKEANNEIGTLSLLCGAILDYLNEHMIDWRGLIKMNLALEASEDMYKIEKS